MCTPLECNRQSNPLLWNDCTCFLACYFQTMSLRAVNLLTIKCCQSYDHSGRGANEELFTKSRMESAFTWHSKQWGYRLVPAVILGKGQILLAEANVHFSERWLLWIKRDISVVSMSLANSPVCMNIFHANWWNLKSGSMTARESGCEGKWKCFFRAGLKRRRKIGLISPISSS